MSGAKLPSGVHAWVWPNPKSPADFVRLCERAQFLGLTGLILQDGLRSPWWARRHNAAKIAWQHGLLLTIGLGMDGRNGWAQELHKVSDAILASLATTPYCMLNWEGKWENDAADRARADQVVDAVLAAKPHASKLCVDAPWWAPLTVRRRIRGKWVHRPTHPRAPTREFGRLCTGQRFVQAYGANVPGSPDGASSRMLQWARDPSQYPSLGTPAANVLPALQGYRRSVTDHVRTLLADDVVCLWHLGALDRECVAALQFVCAIRQRGFTGPDADVRFQLAHSIPGPDIVGPRALAEAGVGVPDGLVWRR